MQEKVFYTSEPEQIKYCQLPDGSADVWLRKNIHLEAVHGREGDELAWTADEVAVNTRLEFMDVVANFDEIYEEGAAEPPVEYSVAERLDAIEDVLVELLEVLG